jgi:hypothetical protein
LFLPGVFEINGTGLSVSAPPLIAMPLNPAQNYNCFPNLGALLYLKTEIKITVGIVF